LHGPEAFRDSLGALLEESIAAYLAQRVPEGETPPRPQRPKPPPPLDFEDQATEDYSDGTFFYTGYQRSPIVLGAVPLLRDNRYAALFTACLGRACDLVLGSFELDETGRMPHLRRQALLLSILAAGLPAVFAEAEQLEEYVAYHRDWLVRAPVLLVRGRMAKARQVLERYDAETARIGPLLLEKLRGLLGNSEPVDSREGKWRQSLVALSAYLKKVRDLDPDPFVRGPLYPSLFKLFHGVANQLGLNPLNEGLTWHLLLQTLRGDGASDSFQLVPS
jgi:hypothetical protein